MTRWFPFEVVPAELESEFQHYFAEQSLSFARTGTIGGAAIDMTFLSWGAVVDPSVVPKTAAIRCLVSA